MCFDVETTGSKRNYDRSIQIAFVVRDHKKEIPEKKSWLINPEGVDSTPKAMATQNIPKSKLKDKPPFSVVGREIVAFLAKHLATRPQPGAASGRAKAGVLVSHNSPTDDQYFFAEMQRAELELPANLRHTIDTLK